jgi:isopentenyl diphosphate isomerase/L-lactate dehydrogenase-like FMN-dependent dehydrogenase
MAIAGEKGVDHVMRSLLADFDILMECAGVNKVEDIKKSRLSELSHARG